MTKKLLTRALGGIPIGITIGFLITIGISLKINTGLYYSAVPSFILEMGNEMNAIVVQTILCGILGATFGAASVVWDIDRFSLLKQTLIYLGIVSIVMYVVAYTTHWMDRSFVGAIEYFVLFLFIFTMIWIIQYLRMRRKIQKLNDKL